MMTPEEREKQRQSFAYGNTHLHNPAITREEVAMQADLLRQVQESEKDIEDGNLIPLDEVINDINPDDHNAAGAHP